LNEVQPTRLPPQKKLGLKGQIAGGYSDYRHYQTLVMSLLRFIA